MKVGVNCRRCKISMKVNREIAFEEHYCPDCGGLQDWSRGCETCGAKPVVMATGLCGPCTFGEAETAGGNW